MDMILCSELKRYRRIHKMDIKLIALDMDGTLLNEKKKFQKRTAAL